MRRAPSCCASAPPGHAAAVPNMPRKSRRFMPADLCRATKIAPPVGIARAPLAREAANKAPATSNSQCRRSDAGEWHDGENVISPRDRKNKAQKKKAGGHYAADLVLQLPA